MRLGWRGAAVREVSLGIGGLQPAVKIRAGISCPRDSLDWGDAGAINNSVCGRRGRAGARRAGRTAAGCYL